jgi:hypothetical protein
VGQAFVAFGPHLIEIRIWEHNLAMGTQHWTADEDRLLGTMTDRDAAKRLGRPRGTIYKRRRKLRLAPFRPYARLWHRVEDELLGTMPDGKLARRLKRSALSVAARRRDRHIPIFHSKKHQWTPTDDKLLSECPDASDNPLPEGRCNWPLPWFQPQEPGLVPERKPGRREKA